jgi:hypothetical protein
VSPESLTDTIKTAGVVPDVGVTVNQFAPLDVVTVKGAAIEALSWTNCEAAVSSPRVSANVRVVGMAEMVPETVNVTGITKGMPPPPIVIVLW